MVLASLINYKTSHILHMKHEVAQPFFNAPKSQNTLEISIRPVHFITVLNDFTLQPFRAPIINSPVHPVFSTQIIALHCERVGIQTYIGSILSHSERNLPPLYVCAFCCHNLNPTECDYDIRNQELIPIKLDLEEWRSSIVILWALFSMMFWSTFTYRSGQKTLQLMHYPEFLLKLPPLSCLSFVLL